jgi:hypothetical protein
LLSYHAYPIRSLLDAVTCPETPLCRVSVSEPIVPSGDVYPAETDPVPPEQLPLLEALPDPSPMQSLASPLEVCEARIRERESIFDGMSSYIELLESCVSSLEPLLPQAQRAELQVFEALAGANAIEARVSLLEQVTARAHFAQFYPHRGTASATEEEVTGRQGGRNRKSGKLSRRILRLTRKGSANLSATGSRTINASRSRRSRTQSPTKKIRTTVTSPMIWP